MNSNEIEAANRAEATAILIRAGYRVYRPEADVSGEDLVVRTPDGKLRLVQMKSRPTVELRRYGGKDIWMLFLTRKAPSPDDRGSLLSTMLFSNGLRTATEAQLAGKKNGTIQR